MYRQLLPKHCRRVDSATSMLVHTGCSRNHHAIPEKPTWERATEDKLPPRTYVDHDTIEKLERLSLVDFGNEEGIERLEAAIRLADELHDVNTENVEPMITPNEDETLFLREDVVKEQNSMEEITRNAALVMDGYFVVPKGNIPVQLESQYKARRKRATTTLQQAAQYHTSVARLGMFPDPHTDEGPVKYSTSKAAKYSSYDSFFMRPNNAPWYQSISVIISTLVLAAYFILREENDLDEYLSKMQLCHACYTTIFTAKDIYEPRKEIEEIAIRTALRQAIAKGKDTSLLRARLLEIEAARAAEEQGVTETQ